jgi:hypothetical protein
MEGRAVIRKPRLVEMEEIGEGGDAKEVARQ